MAAPLKILIVDDDPLDADLLQQELEHLEHEICACNDGQMALDRLTDYSALNLVLEEDLGFFAVALHGERPELRYVAALLEAARGRADRARAEMEAFLALSPSNHPQRGRARVLLERWSRPAATRAPGR